MTEDGVDRHVRHVPSDGDVVVNSPSGGNSVRFICNLANFLGNPVQREGIKQWLLTALCQRAGEGRAKVFRTAEAAIVIGKVELV